MKTYDWIVVGGGITGASLAYELSKQNLQVLLLEKDLAPDNATVYSYGGLAYWSGTDEVTRQLGKEGIELHRQLADELEGETEFRELDLVLTIDRQDNPEIIAQNYDCFALTPELLSVEEACQLEPLLNPHAIAGVLKLPHGHIHPQKTTHAYLQAFQRLGGEIKYERVIDLQRSQNTVRGVETTQNIYHAASTVICAGGLTRSLLQTAGIVVDNYFTHAQVIVTPPVDTKLSTIVMPAVQQRFTLEALGKETAWDNAQDIRVKSILDAGAVQFLDGSCCLGQVSAIATNPHAQLDTSAGEQEIRQEIANILPLLAKIPGTCHHCLVAFNNRAIALVGNLQNTPGLYLFSGFTSTLVFAPILARRFAHWVTGTKDEIIEHLQITND